MRHRFESCPADQFYMTIMRTVPRGITKSFTPREKLIWKWYPTPGFINDPLDKCSLTRKTSRCSRFSFGRKFLKWNKLSEKTHRLYWRLHPEAYASISGGKKP